MRAQLPSLLRQSAWEAWLEASAPVSDTDREAELRAFTLWWDDRLEQGRKRFAQMLEQSRAEPPG